MIYRGHDRPREEARPFAGDVCRFAVRRHGSAGARRAMAWYLEGLLLDGNRKSIEPMAARLVDEPAGIEAMRQRLQQCVSVSAWSDDEVRARLARKVQDELPEIEALVLDDTGFPKQGQALGRRGEAVLRHAGADRQLPGRGEPPPGRRARQLLHRDAALPSRGVDERSGAVPRGRRPRRRGLPAQVGDRASLCSTTPTAGASPSVCCSWTRATARSPSSARRSPSEAIRTSSAWAATRWSGCPAPLPIAPSDWRRPRGHSGPARTRYRDGKHSPVSLLALATALGRKAAARFAGARAQRERSGRASAPSA